MLNPEDFPADTHGDALRRLLASGDDLSQPRFVDFTFVFGRGSGAAQFAARVAAAGLPVACCSACEVIVSPRMVPNYASVVEREAALSAWAAELGGSFDGWGCLSVKGTDHA